MGINTLHGHSPISICGFNPKQYLDFIYYSLLKPILYFISNKEI
jgi:hypothetical protein